MSSNNNIQPRQQSETIEREVNRRINLLIVDNPRLAPDFLILQTAALIGVSATLGAMETYDERGWRELDEASASMPIVG